MILDRDKDVSMIIRVLKRFWAFLWCSLRPRSRREGLRSTLLKTTSLRFCLYFVEIVNLRGSEGALGEEVTPNLQNLAKRIGTIQSQVKFTVSY